MSIRKWKINSPNESDVLEIMNATGVAKFPAKLLASRGVSGSDAKDFLMPTRLGNPFDIKDMDKAVLRINNAISENEKICIFGDYDCDGVCATVILKDYLMNIGARVWHYIPDRAKGYGLSNEAIDLIKENETDLIITVDNGISSIDEAEYIYKLGMQLIVTDHHQVGDILPRAEAVVNPHRADDQSGFDGYCGAGVAFRLVCALEDGDNDFITEQYGDIVSLATIGDIVPLVKENRTIVKNGLPLIENTNRIGLLNLVSESAVSNSPFNSTSVAYRLVPRINATGRFSNANLAVDLLMCDEADKALELAKELCDINSKRKQTENEIYEKIEQQINENPEKLCKRVLIFSGENWHYGVLGIVAAKLLETYRKPVIVLNIEDGVLHGSARSIDGFSIYDALTACSDTLIKYGGHHKAAGLTLNACDIEKFEKQIEDYAYEKYPQMPDDYAVADLLISPDEINVESILASLCLEPFGEANRKPVYALQGTKIVAIKPVKEGKYTQLQLDYGGVPIQAISFKIPTDEFLFSVLDSVDILANAEINEYKGNKKVSLQIQEIRPHEFDDEKYYRAKQVYEDMKTGKTVTPDNKSKLLPTREDMVKVYKMIKNKTLTIDNLCFLVSKENINYALLKVILDAFCECNIAKFDAAGDKISGLASDKKVDLMNTQIIKFLKG